jgi:hypothetical protein
MRCGRLANKATNGNDGLVWQHKGSGYNVKNVSNENG